MKRLLLGIGLLLVLTFVVVGIYLKYFMFIPDKDGMIYHPSYLMEVTPYNSGSSELGEPVGYGQGDTMVFDVRSGDVFYEGGGDVLLRNPSRQEAKESFGFMFEIKELDDHQVVLSLDEGEQQLALGETTQIFSHLLVLDGASTHYEISFRKAEE